MPPPNPDLHPTSYLVEASKFLGIKSPWFTTISSTSTAGLAAVTVVELVFNNVTFRGYYSSFLGAQI